MSPPDAPETRRRVHAAVRAYPGIHVRGLERELGISGPLAQYHVKKLEEAGYIEAREQGGYMRYFPTSKGSSTRVKEGDVPLLGLLREQTPLHIVLLLLDHGPLAHAQLVEYMTLAKSTTSYHLAKLAQLDIVEREPGTNRIRLRERDRMYELLLAYTPTASLLDSFADLWDDLYGRR